MSKATWDEIKNLASDFKSAQESSSINKISERNCIDIIHYLIENNLIKLYFTNDGKSFLTPEELEKEIYEELEVQSDRVSLTQIATSLDIDLFTIETCVNKMLCNNDNLQIVQNCLINSAYSRRVALQINDIVKEKGRTDIVELTELFDLPKQFIDKLINTNLNTIIEAYKEGDFIFTNAFVRRNTSIIRGYLTRVTKPVSISSIIQKKSNLPEKLIQKVILSMIDENRLMGSLDQNKTVFVPNVYLKNQKSYLNMIYTQNGYVNFTTLKEIGIYNPSKFIEQEFPSYSVVLSNCALSETITCQFEESLDEVIRNKSCVDCYQILPISINLQDLHVLVKKFSKSHNSLIVLECGYIIFKDFPTKVFSYFEDLMKIRAEEYAKLHRKTLVTILSEESFMEMKNDDNCNEDSAKACKPLKSKTGGGQRGRELKNKVVKNKYMSDKKKKGNDTETEKLALVFLTENEAVDFLMTKFKENYPEDFLIELYSLIESNLNSKFRIECQSVILQTSDTAKNKLDHKKIESTITTMFNKIRVFQKGVSEISNIDIQKSLTKFHLKTVCTDLVNCLFEYLASDNELNWDNNNLNDSRNKLVAQLKGNLLEPVKSLNKSLKDDESFESFFTATENVCSSIGLYPKKLDKKNEKRIAQEIAAQYQSIIETKVENNEEIDPAELLLITTLLLFQKIMGYPVHGSGKFVPILLPLLQEKKSIESIDWTQLTSYQEYVVNFIKATTDEEKTNLKLVSKDLHQSILDIVLNWKKLK